MLEYRMFDFSPAKRGPAMAIGAAALFGISPALAKPVLENLHPALIAGLLYLGSAAGLSFICGPRAALSAIAALPARQQRQLAGAVLCGGVLAPLCLAWGLKLAGAFEVSLLLNLETVFTTTLAVLLFREHVTGRVWLAMLIIAAGAALLGLTPASGGFSAGGLLIAAACALWGLDNNLTRAIESLSAASLGWFKGLTAGSFNIVLAFALDAAGATAGQTAALLGIGVVSYGLSLVLFIAAMRAIGSARAGAYFAAGPFFGLALSVLMLGEKPGAPGWLAAALMAAGLILLFGERHEHAHRHDPLAHAHSHIHNDGHHTHAHPGLPPDAAHDHPHEHEPLTHEHPHFPDTHHRHAH